MNLAAQRKDELESGVDAKVEEPDTNEEAKITSENQDPVEEPKQEEA